MYVHGLDCSKMCNNCEQQCVLRRLLLFQGACTARLRVAAPRRAIIAPPMASWVAWAAGPVAAVA